MVRQDPPLEAETGTSLDTVPYGTLPPGPDPDADREIDRLIWESVRTNYQALIDKDSAKTALAGDLLEQALMHWVTSGRLAEHNFSGIHVIQVLAMLRFGIATERLGAGKPMFPELGGTD